MWHYITRVHKKTGYVIENSLYSLLVCIIANLWHTSIFWLPIFSGNVSIANLYITYWRFDVMSNNDQKLHREIRNAILYNWGKVPGVKIHHKCNDAIFYRLLLLQQNYLYGESIMKVLPHFLEILLNFTVCRGHCKKQIN